MTEHLSKYIVKDPKICHGAPIFKGTRILVADVLEQVASGMDWGAIIDEWRGSISIQAVSDAVHLAKDAFIETKANIVVEQVTL